MSAERSALPGRRDRGDDDVPPPKCCPAIAVAASCPNVMPCHCERLKVRLTMVPLNAALAAKPRVSRSGVVSGRNEQKIGP